MKRCTCLSSPDSDRRGFLTGTVAAAAAISVAGAGFSVMPAKAALGQGQKKFMEEATKLAIESSRRAGAGRSAR